MAEGRGKAQAITLRRTRTAARAKKLLPNGQIQLVSATELRRGDMVLVEAGDLIPGDGEVLKGVASVNEAAITGESAPVIPAGCHSHLMHQAHSRISPKVTSSPS